MTHSHPEQWERQRELLSAHLDGALEPHEDAALQEHLITCAACQRELAALRQTRALVAALPSPALPRSFTLPDTPDTRRAILRPVPGWARPVQQLGGIAAMIGAALLCAAALPSIHFGGAAANYSSSAPSFGSSHTYGGASTAPANTTAAPAQTDQTSKYPPAPTPTEREVTSSPTPIEPTQPFPYLPVSGGVLLVGGIGAAVAGEIARRRPRDGR